jgi:hypothetical protein
VPTRRGFGETYQETQEEDSVGAKKKKTLKKTITSQSKSAEQTYDTSFILFHTK